MTELTIYSKTLTANEEDRTISGLLLPWEEIGHTSAGSVTASKGTLTLPENPSEIFLNLQHQQDSRLGRATALEEREDGLHATFRVAKTTAGNDLLEEVKEGLRAHLSIEISNPVIKAGKILAGLISGAAAVCTPAFKSASIYSLTAADCGATPLEKETQMDTESNTPETIEVSTAPVQAAPLFAQDASKLDLVSLTMANVANGAEALNAALTVVNNATDGAKVYVADQEIGEIWSAKKVSRPLINAFGVKTLTSLTVSGRKVERTFEVRPYAAGATEVPSIGAISSERITKNAQPYGGAARIPAELIEFGSSDTIAELYSEGLDDYARRTETAFATALLAGATKQTTAMDSVLTVVDNASQAFAASGSNMDIIVVSPAVFSGLVNLPASQAPWWFAGQATLNLANSNLSGAGVTFGVSTALTGGQVLIADKRSASYWESKDFRMQALAVANFAVDVNLVKFNAEMVNDAGAVFHYTNVGTEINAPEPTAPAA